MRTTLLLTTALLLISAQSAWAEGNCNSGRIVNDNGVDRCVIDFKIKGQTQSTYVVDPKNSSQIVPNRRLDKGAYTGVTKSGEPSKSSSSSSSKSSGSSSSGGAAPAATASTSSGGTSSGGGDFMSNTDCSKYTGSTKSKCEELKMNKGSLYSDTTAGESMGTYTTYGQRNGGRQAWRIPKKGPQMGKSIKVVFSDGYTVIVPDTSKNFRQSNGFVFKPGLGYNGHGDSNTGTAHGGIYIHSPYGRHPQKVTIYAN